MQKLLVFIFFILLSLSCAQPEQRVVRGGTSRDPKNPDMTRRREERTSLREFGRDFKGRYSEKTLKQKYGMSDKQLETAKRELMKKDPSFATKASQSPAGFQMPQTTE